MSAFLIRPLEAVFFGPPQGFNAGEAHRADSLFPPSPYSFQGMVRSQLLRAATPPLDLDDNTPASRALRAELVGEPDRLPVGWQLIGPLPARVRLRTDADSDRPEPVIEPWVPAPRLLLGPAPEVRRAAPITSTQPAIDDRGSAAMLLGRPGLATARTVDGWIGPKNLQFALTGRGAWHAASHHESLPPFVHRESRPGLALDAGGTARHGMLYFLETLRFEQRLGEPSGLLGWLVRPADASIPVTALTDGLGSAGRKQRPAAFMSAPALDPGFADALAGRHLPDRVAEDRRFWLITLTPVALPRPDQPIDRVGEGIRFETLAMLTGPTQTLGGYRYADASSRANRAYLPAGTCWLFRLQGGDPESRAEALARLHHAHRLGDPAEAAFGFGHTLAGLGPTPQEHAP